MTTKAAKGLGGVEAAAVLSWAAAGALGTGRWPQLCCLWSRLPWPCWRWCWRPCNVAILAVAACLVLVGVVLAAFVVVVMAAVLAGVLVPLKAVARLVAVLATIVVLQTLPLAAAALVAVILVTALVGFRVLWAVVLHLMAIYICMKGGRVFDRVGVTGLSLLMMIMKYH